MGVPLEEMDRLFNDSPPNDLEAASLIRSSRESDDDSPASATLRKRPSPLSRSGSATTLITSAGSSWNPFRRLQSGSHQSRGQPVQPKDYQSVSREENENV